MKEKSNGEIVIYKAADGSAQLDVRLEEETVWLTQAQLIILFQTTKQNISLHINNFSNTNGSFSWIDNVICLGFW